MFPSIGTVYPYDQRISLLCFLLFVMEQLSRPMCPYGGLPTLVDPKHIKIAQLRHINKAEMSTFNKIGFFPLYTSFQV